MLAFDLGVSRAPGRAFSTLDEVAIALLELLAIFAQGVGLGQSSDDVARSGVGDDRKDVRLALLEEVERGADRRLRQEEIVAPLGERADRPRIVEACGGGIAHEHPSGRSALGFLPKQYL